MKHSTELTLIEYCFDHMPECVCATNVPNERATLKCGGPAKAALRHACEIFSAHNCNFSSGQYPKINQNSIFICGYYSHENLSVLECAIVRREASILCQHLIFYFTFRWQWLFIHSVSIWFCAMSSREPLSFMMGSVYCENHRYHHIMRHSNLMEMFSKSISYFITVIRMNYSRA